MLSESHKVVDTNEAGSERVASALLIEDDSTSAALTKQFLENAMFQVAIEPRGDRAVETTLATSPDVVLLDLMLPGKDGFAICRELRAANFDNPIIVLSALDGPYDVVLGLEIGADEYVVKPVEPRILLARIRAVLRRSKTSSHNAPAGQVLRFNRLKINRQSRTAMYGSTRIPMSAADFDLLWFLAVNSDKIVTRDEIYKALFGADYDGVTRSIDTRVARLRQRFESCFPGINVIRTARPTGYLFTGPDGPEK